MNENVTDTMMDSMTSRFNRAYQESSLVGIEQGRRFRDLADAMADLAKTGIHQNVIFPDELTQKAWVNYQEMHGNLVPRSPDEPPLMPIEDAEWSR